MEHRAAAVSAAVRHRPRRIRSAVLAADAGVRSSDCRPRVALSPHPDRPCFSGDRRGQLCRPRTRPAGTQLAHGELCTRRRDRRACGLCRRRDAAGLLCQRADAYLLRFRCGGAGRDGQQPRRRRRRPPAWTVSTDRQLPGRRHLRLGGGLHGVHPRSAGAPRRSRRRDPSATRLMDTQATQLRPGGIDVLGAANRFNAALPFLALLVVGISFPLFGGGYWGVIATRACVYWVLVSGLNLVVGFGGQIAIGWVALLTLGAYTTSVLVAGNVTPAVPPYLALAIAAVVGAVFGLIVGLPALRLRTFYFAITTLGFATIVTQVALAWQSVTGGGVGVAGPVFPEPFASQWGFYYFCFGLAAICTWMTANIAASRFGRALTAIRDAEVAAEASGIAKPKLLMLVFLFSGATAAIAGGLFASLQSYITPDAFTVELSVLFFIAILIGGRGSIMAPLLGTILLTALPQVAAPLVAWSPFLYVVLLLAIVLLMPGGIAELLDFKNRKPLESNRAIVPRPDLLKRLLGQATNTKPLTLDQVELRFGGVRA